MTAKIFVSGIAGFLVTLIAMIALRPVAVAIELVDRPGGRKTHHGNVPIVGGLAMFLGLIVGMAFLPAASGAPSGLFAAACALLVVLGLLDDRFELSAAARLLAHGLIISAMAAGSGFMVHSIGDPFGLGSIVFSGVSAYVCTLIFVAGAVNAFNMLDGMDGLAGAMALVALVSFVAVGLSAGQLTAVGMAILLSGVIIGFLIFNLPARFNRQVRCFMGDGGSTLLGFVLATISISLSQGPDEALSPVFVLWFAAMPVYELLWTILRRLLRGRSPFSADREHMHHLLLDAGFGVRAAFIVLLCFGVFWSSVGLALRFIGAPDWVSFAGFIACGGITLKFMYDAPSHLQRLPLRLQRVAVSRISDVPLATKK